ncbi:MAG: cobalamin-dependent protein [Chloroflexota bacterium]
MTVAPSDAPLYNTAAVVQRTGVPAVTFRAWERRYGFPKPHRDPSGQRLYSERDIGAITWLAAQTARGVAISRAVAMVQSGHASPNEPTQPLTPTGARAYSALRRELTEALVDLDPARAESILGEAFGLFSVEDVCLHVLEPVLVDVGNRWHAGELSVADEHYASSFVRTRLFSLLRTYDSVDARGPLILTACAPNEWHEVGILLVSVFLVRRGYAVRYLGPNLPIDGLWRMISRHRPPLVIVSAQSAETARELSGAAHTLAQVRGVQTRLLVGGQAFNEDPTLRAAIDGEYVGPSAAATVATVERLLGPAFDRRRFGEPVNVGLEPAQELAAVRHVSPGDPRRGTEP